MRYFVYKTFTWTTVILAALFGTAFVSFVLGALGMAWCYEESEKTKTTSGSDPK